jgi:hypothetical protein
LSQGYVGLRLRGAGTGYCCGTAAHPSVGPLSQREGEHRAGVSSARLSDRKRVRQHPTALRRRRLRRYVSLQWSRGIDAKALAVDSFSAPVRRLRAGTYVRKSDAHSHLSLSPLREELVTRTGRSPNGPGLRLRSLELSAAPFGAHSSQTTIRLVPAQRTLPAASLADPFLSNGRAWLKQS